MSKPAEPPAKPEEKHNPSKAPRTFSVMDFHTNSPKYESNFVSTTRYTALTFLPLSLLNQFKRYANIYFLALAIIQSIPAVSPINPVSSIAPLIFVISLSILREGFEDLARHKSDLELNASKSAKYKSGEWLTCDWKDIVVGDFIKVNNGEFFPADMICIRSSDPEGNCFIQTSSLDGEKNLKPRMAVVETQAAVENPNILRLAFQIELEKPNSDLHSCNGTLQMGNDRKIQLEENNLLLRGSVLKNTDWVIGAVGYTGRDSKIMKNAEDSKNKQSQIEVKTNKLIVIIFFAQLVLCIIAGILCTIWFSTNKDAYSQYFSAPNNPVLEGFLLFLTMIVLTGTMIPISLIVSLEMVKLVQAFFINNDEDMYFAENEKHCKVFTSSLNEELGQIEFIFSDKTGTLTCNKMEFKHMIVGDTLFGKEESGTPAQQAQAGGEGRSTLLQDSTFGQPQKEVKKPTAETVSYNFRDERLDQLNQGIIGGDKEVNIKLCYKDDTKESKPVVTYKMVSDLTKEFLFLLSVCHGCLVDTNEEGVSSYQGQSPDEITLVDAAKRLGFEFTGSNSLYKNVKIFGTPTRIRLLKYFEFNSDRKRASVIIKDKETGVIKLLTKGADSIIIDRLSKTKKQPYLELIKEKLTKFSTIGLRTLCMAERVLTEEEYQDLDQKMLEAAIKPDKKTIIDKLTEEVEKDLTLIGCTAVEDKLQNQVALCIRDFIRADIKVWMLTGDKLETAENIGYSCKLIQSDFERLYIFETDDLQAKYDELSKKIKDLKSQGQKICLLVEGKAITKLLTLNELKIKIINDVMTKCESVICCRVNPKEKADVVRLVKENLGKITLAIGDGANDVNMIQEAHIGIGIYGQEGMRAVQASDYALPEFKALWKLLLVHGRLSYIRISDMILYFFYKNMIFTAPQFLFLFYNGYSGQTIYDDWYITFYNLAFTSFPLVVRALFDKDIYYRYWSTQENGLKFSPRLKDYYSYLYYIGQKSYIFTIGSAIKWIVVGLAFGSLIFFLVTYSLQNLSLNSSGATADVWYTSILIYTSMILLVDLKIGMYTKTWTFLNWVSILLLSIVIYVAFMFGGDVLTFFNSNRTVVELYITPHFYMLNLLFFIAAFLYDQLVLIWEKETETPLSILYRSIKVRYRDVAEEYYEKVIAIRPYEKQEDREMHLKQMQKDHPHDPSHKNIPPLVSQPQPLPQKPSDAMLNPSTAGHQTAAPKVNK